MKGKSRRLERYEEKNADQRSSIYVFFLLTVHRPVYSCICACGGDKKRGIEDRNEYTRPPKERRGLATTNVTNKQTGLR